MPLRFYLAALLVCTLPPRAPAQGSPTWTPVPGHAGRPPTNQYLMAFDASRGRCVLVNGSEIWEAAGSTWELVASGPGLGGVDGAFAFDPGRGTCVWFGGGFLIFTNNETHEWDGTEWRRIVTAHAPSPRSQPAMAYDASRQRMVLYGGLGGGGRLGDTWEFDGLDWSRVATATRPPALNGHRMAYDAQRGEVVMVGNDGARSRIWLFDGTDWRIGPADPPSMTRPALIYDQVRQRTVLASGSARLGDTIETWEWDGSAWHRAQAAGPPLLHLVNGTYDPVRRCAMIAASSPDGLDLWRWDGQTWHAATPFGSPSSLEGTAFGWHEPTRSVITFGGGVSFFVTGDTHAYRNGTWARLSPARSPSARNGAAMASESTGHLLLMGGRFGAASDETWRWTGADWRQLTPTTSPPARSHHGMATDTARGRIVLFGGQDAAGAPLNDTWEWDGTRWNLQQPAVSPPPLSEPAMTYDPVRGEVLLFGGTSGSRAFSDSLWAWDGATWSLRTTSTRPPPRARAAFAFDPESGAAVLAGGYVYGGFGINTPVADSWLWDGASWRPVAGAQPDYGIETWGIYHPPLRAPFLSTRGVDHALVDSGGTGITQFGTGCGGSVSPPQLSARSLPRAGNDAFGVFLTQALASTTVFWGLDTAAGQLPLGGGCTALLASPVFIAASTDPAGNALLPLPIPADPALQGVELYVQAIALDPRGQLAGVAAASAGVRIRID